MKPKTIILSLLIFILIVTGMYIYARIKKSEIVKQADQTAAFFSVAIIAT